MWPCGIFTRLCDFSTFSSCSCEPDIQTGTPHLQHHSKNGSSRKHWSRSSHTAPVPSCHFCMWNPLPIAQLKQAVSYEEGKKEILGPSSNPPPTFPSCLYTTNPWLSCRERCSCNWNPTYSLKYSTDSLPPKEDYKCSPSPRNHDGVCCHVFPWHVKRHSCSNGKSIMLEVLLMASTWPSNAQRSLAACITRGSPKEPWTTFTLVTKRWLHHPHLFCPCSIFITVNGKKEIATLGS